MIFFIWKTQLKPTEQSSFQFETLYGSPLVKTKVNGHEVSLVLDLGSFFSSLDSKSISNAKLKETEGAHNSRGIYGDKKSKKIFKVPEVLINNIIFKNITFFESAGCDSETEKSIPRELTYGRIGREPFLNKILFIDRKKEKCIVETSYPNKNINPEKFDKGIWIESDFNLEKGIGIVLSVIIEHLGLKRLVLDTGSNVSILDKKGIPKLPLTFCEDGGTAELKLKNGESLGSHDFLYYDLSEVELQGFLGFDFLQHYMVCLDFLNKKIFFKKYVE